MPHLAPWSREAPTAPAPCQCGHHPPLANDDTGAPEGCDAWCRTEGVRRRVSRRCGANHNKDDYSDADKVTLANMGLGRFGLDKTRSWQLCGSSLNKCKEACVALGDCAEISVNKAGTCCHFAKSMCKGARLKKGTKYRVERWCGTQEAEKTDYVMREFQGTQEVRQRMHIRRIGFRCEEPMQHPGCAMATSHQQCVRNNGSSTSEHSVSQHFVFIGGLQRSGTTSAKSLVLQLLGPSASGMEDRRQNAGRIAHRTASCIGGSGSVEGKYVQSVIPPTFWLADRLHGCKPTLVHDADQCVENTSQCAWGTGNLSAKLKQDWECWWADRHASVLVEKSPENILMPTALQAIFQETPTHFIFVSRHPLPWALALDSFKKTRAAPLDLRLSVWLEVAERMAQNGKRLRSWSWVPYELIGEPGVLASTLQGLLPHVNLSLATAELSRRLRPGQKLAPQLLSSNARYAVCWERGVPLGGFELALGNSSEDECASRRKGSPARRSQALNRDMLQRAALHHGCHLSSFGYTFTLTRTGAVDTSFQPGLVRPNALREALPRNLPWTPRLAPPRMDVIVLEARNRRGCTVGLDCEDRSAIKLGMNLRQAQIVGKLQSLGFQVHLVGGQNALGWIQRMEGCLRWRLRAVVVLYTTLGIDAQRFAAKGANWTSLPLHTRRSDVTSNSIARYPGELLDIAINRLKGISHGATTVVVTDDVHHHRIVDTLFRDDTRAVQDWLMRKERRIYTTADSALTISDQDAQTIARLVGEGHSQAVHVLPYAPDTVARRVIPYEERRGGILFVGNTHPVAVRSMKWFLDQVLPIITSGLQSQYQSRGSVGCCTSSPLFTLAGHGRRWQKLEADPKLVVVRDSVTPDELERLYVNAKVFVAPNQMTHPSGISTKAINAIARGLPVVTTSLMDAGLPPTPAGQVPAVRVGADASAFASHVLELLVDASAWSAQQKAGSSFLDRQAPERAQLSVLRTVLALPGDV